METMELLEKYFDVAFAAPAGVKRLRELILSLAMQGKLVPQDPSDQPASELLKEIEVEKKRLVKEGKIKKYEKLPEITSDEIPYEIPESWEWVRLGEVIIFTNGFAFKSNLFQNKGIGVVKIGDITNGIIVKDKMSFIDESMLKDIDKKFQVILNDLVIAMSGATTGKLGFNKLKEIFLLNQRVGKIEPINIDKYFLYNFLSTQIQKNLDISSGSAIPNLSTEQIIHTIIPLPSLAEQRRIVEKIDSLMCRCDELEKLQSERNQKRLIVHVAAKDRLLSAKDDTEFSSAWEFIYNHFGDLYSVKENVSELRKVILQLAVMGKLVPQDPNDEPASELLKKIEAEKQRLIKEGKIKKQKPLPEIKPVEFPYDLPKSWKWLRLGNVIVFGPTNGFSPKAVEYETSVRSLTLSATTSGKFKGEYSKFIDYEIPLDSHLWLQDGDILVQRGNTLEYVGVSAIYRGKANYYIYPDLMMKIRISLKLDTDYIHLAMSSEKCREFLRIRASGTSGTMPKINQTTLINLPIPLPPLQEQKRIVAKVDQLMTLCDQLEQKIEQTTGTQTTLLNAVMANL